MTHILVIEDNPIDVLLLRRVLGACAEWPTQITLIDDGQKAIWYLQSLESGGIQEPPLMVLLDLNLPKYNGFQVMEQFRKSAAAEKIPIFLWSSIAAEQIAAEAESHNLHADAYFEKPLGLAGFEQIAKRMREYAQTSFSEPRTVAA